MSVDNPRVFIVDDDPTVRESLVWLLNGEGFVTESFVSGHEFLGRAQVLTGGCALVDLRMPDINGFDLLNRITDRFPHLPVVMISGHGDIRTAVNAIKNGAWDFIKKPFDAREIINAVRGAVTEFAAHRYPPHARQKSEDLIEGLTPREKEVCDLVIAGKTSREIAKRLCISTRTVSAHRASIKARTGATSVAHLIRMSLQKDQGGASS